MVHPKSVTAAFWITVAQTALSVVFGLVAMFFVFAVIGRDRNVDQGAATVAQLIFSGVSVVIAIIIVLIAIAMRAGRNWARILLIVLSILSIVFTASGLFGGSESILDMGVDLITIALEIVVVVLLLSSSASAFFAAVKQRNNSRLSVAPASPITRSRTTDDESTV